MTLAQTINKADNILTAAAEEHSAGNHEGALSHMLDLRQLVNEPIEIEEPGKTDDPENCTLCGKPKE